MFSGSPDGCMSDADPIVCKPTKWFIWRAVAMIAMFVVLGGWFFKDWKVGYPNKNLAYYTYKAFEKAEAEFRERRAEGQSRSGWVAFAEAQKIEFPEGEGVLPAGVSRDQGWPEILRDYERLRVEADKPERKTGPLLWSDYSNERGWEERPKKGYEAGTIRNQLIYAIICWVLAAAGLFVLQRTLGRTMKVDEGAYYPPGGEGIPFGQIVRIDKRRWDSKGLATLIYRDASGAEKKARIDGMVYGQFHAEEGAPAQALFDRVMANFSGELVDLSDGESTGSGESGDVADSG